MKPKKIGNKTHNIEKLDYVKMRIAATMCSSFWQTAICIIIGILAGNFRTIS